MFTKTINYFKSKLKENVGAYSLLGITFREWGFFSMKSIKDIYRSFMFGFIGWAQGSHIF